jgi:hypothetical protein
VPCADICIGGRKDLGKRLHCPVIGCSFGLGGKEMNRLDVLSNHFKRKHIAAKSFKCDVPGCSKTFSDRQSMNRHANFCGTDYECGTCNTKFSCRESLVSHLQGTTNPRHEGLGTKRRRDARVEARKQEILI